LPPPDVVTGSRVESGRLRDIDGRVAPHLAD
jgi:hypothetical protein